MQPVKDGCKQGTPFLTDVYLRHSYPTLGEALLLRGNKSILLVSSRKAGKYENVTPLCKRIIRYRVYPKMLIGLKYDVRFTEIHNYYYYT